MSCSVLILNWSEVTKLVLKLASKNTLRRVKNSKRPAINLLGQTVCGFREVCATQVLVSDQIVFSKKKTLFRLVNVKIIEITSRNARQRSHTSGFRIDTESIMSRYFSGLSVTREAIVNPSSNRTGTGSRSNPCSVSGTGNSSTSISCF